MLRQFQVPAELQQFLSGVNSKALTNVTWDTSFSADAPVLPLSAESVRRSLAFSKYVSTEYDCLIQNLDGSGAVQITEPR